MNPSNIHTRTIIKNGEDQTNDTVSNNIDAIFFMNHKILIKQRKQHDTHTCVPCTQQQKYANACVYSCVQLTRKLMSLMHVELYFE